MERSVVDVFRQQAQARLDQFYRCLGLQGEVSPVSRLRLEGFLEAGLVLELISRADIECWLRHYTQLHLDAQQQVALPALTDSDDSGIVLPVRWSRAPVRPS